MKNKLWKRKTVCDVCKGEVVYNQTHHWIYCPCTAPVKMELSQDVLNDQWTSIKKAKHVSEGLKQKIRQGKAIHLKCGTPISLLPLGWFCTTCSSYIDKSIVVRIEDVDKLLDEAAKQVRLAFSEGVNEHGYHWHYDGPDYARARCEQIIELYEQRTLPEILQKILAILEGKEKAKP